jgi:DMSO/TMAO reductase YedYZ molybdopterin-dependent catalytic subunit
MNNLTRRRLFTTGLAIAAGATGIKLAASIARRHGLMPPDDGTLYGAGETLNYASHRLLARDSMARELPRSEISKVPFANETGPRGAAYDRLQASGFVDWKLTIDGMVARPDALSLAGIRAYPSRSHITHLACEEGWSYVAEWTGAPLAHILDLAGVLPRAKYVIYYSLQPGWWDSIDIDEARHPQTLLAYGMNGSDLPADLGGPLRMRVPRQLGYKSVKYISRLTVTDTLKGFGKGLGAAAPEGGYAWYAGI